MYNESLSSQTVIWKVVHLVERAILKLIVFIFLFRVLILMCAPNFDGHEMLMYISSLILLKTIFGIVHRIAGHRIFRYINFILIMRICRQRIWFDILV